MVISEEARKGMERLDQLRDLSREVDMLRSQISELQGEIEQEKETVQRLEGELVEEKEKARSPEEIMRSDLKELIQSGFVAGHTLSQILSEVRHYFMNKAGTEDLSEGDLEAEEV
jgi:predicted  nucleic acid-binding Zn-ribbon protein